MNEEKKTPAVAHTAGADVPAEGNASHPHYSTTDEPCQGGVPGWTMPEEPEERSRLINNGICPLCGGIWMGGPEGHGAACPNARPSTSRRNGAGRGWRRGRGQERHSTRGRRMTCRERRRAQPQSV